MILKPPKGAQLQRGHPLARDLVGCWLFNEGSGSRWNDLSGNGCVASSNSADIVWSHGPYGPALLFPGDALKWVTLSGQVVAQSYSAFSLVLWVCGTGSTMGLVYSGGTDLYLNVTSTTMTWRHVDIGDGTSTATVPNITSGWHMVGCSWDGARTTGIVDGRKYGGEAATGTMTIPAWRLGVGGAGQELSGHVGLVAVWKRGLSAGESAELYREPFGMFRRQRIELWTPAVSGGAPAGGLLRHPGMAGGIRDLCGGITA